MMSNRFAAAALVVVAALVSGLGLLPTVAIAQNIECVHPLPQGNSLNDCTFNADLGEFFAVGDVESAVRINGSGPSVSRKIGGAPSPLFEVTRYVNGTAYARGEFKLIKTTNNGATWSHVSGAPPGVGNFDFANSITGHREDANKILVAGSLPGSPHLLFSSDDCGATWTAINNVGVRSDQVIAHVYRDKNDPNWIIVVAKKAIDLEFLQYYYFSTDGGATWESSGLTAPLGPGAAFGPRGIASSSSPPPTAVPGAAARRPTDTTRFLMAVGRGGSVARSWDAGLTFDSSNVGTTADLNDISMPDTNHAIVVSAAGEIFYTLDGGDTWLPGTVDNDLWLTAVAHKSVDTALAVGVFGVIFQTTDAGATWIEISEGPRYRLLSVHFPCGEIGYACGEFGTIVKTIDGGQTWMELNSGVVTEPLQSVFFTDSITGYVVGLFGSILRTVDGGVNWALRPSASGLANYSIHFPSPDTGYAVGEGGVFKTTDGGGNWTNVDSTTIFVLRSTFFLDVDTGFAVGGNCTIRKTVNGGTDWSTIPCPVGVFTTLESIHFPDADTGYIVGAAGAILKSSDGGSSWEDVSTGMSRFYSSVFFTSPTDGWAVGSDFFSFAQFGTLMRTTDGGATWTELIELSTTANTLSAVHFPVADTGYVVGDGGTILKVTLDAGACGPGTCANQGDVAPIATLGDGIINLLDVVALIDFVFRSGAVPPTDKPPCPNDRADVAPYVPGVQCGDGIINLLDIVFLIDHVFRSGSAPCDPCSP